LKRPLPNNDNKNDDIELATDPWDLECLKIEQAAAGHHRIFEIFKEIFEGVWLSSFSNNIFLTKNFAYGIRFKKKLH
jgi:hypothetical protein